MKKSTLLLILLYTCLLSSMGHTQQIPYGTSIDTFQVMYDKTFRDTFPFNNANMIVEDSSVYTPFEIYYYKPSNYDSSNSPILWSVHGLTANGYEPIPNLQTIADRRKALIVSLTMKDGFAYDYTSDYTQISNDLIYFYFGWYPTIFKQIYQHTLFRENRDSIPVHLIGFSAGGQFVTRYMLLRQSILDSIPIVMAVSTDPYSYTFCTDSLKGIEMFYPCGLSGGVWGPITTSEFNCNEQVIQYYNENYGVLIGTADTVAAPLYPCIDVQGANRYERAQNFYNFSDTNAITRGTTLKWQYAEVPGAAHWDYPLYNTVATGDSIPIAERMLFETPWHPVPQLAPVASFTANTSIIYLPNASVQFTNNSINATSYLWDFGDGITSTALNPSHTYASADTFTVKLIASTGSSCTNTLTKKYYIIVKSAMGVNPLAVGNGQLGIYPNPTNGKFTIQMDNGQLSINNYQLSIYNVLGECIHRQIATSSNLPIDLSAAPNGVYCLQLKTSEGVSTKKIIINK